MTGAVTISSAMGPKGIFQRKKSSYARLKVALIRNKGQSQINFFREIGRWYRALVPGAGTGRWYRALVPGSNPCHQ